MYVIKGNLYTLKDDVLSKYSGQKLRAVPQDQDTSVNFLLPFMEETHNWETQLEKFKRKTEKH